MFTVSLLMSPKVFICTPTIIWKNNPGASSDKQILFSFTKGKEHRGMEHGEILVFIPIPST